MQVANESLTTPKYSGEAKGALLKVRRCRVQENAEKGAPQIQAPGTALRRGSLGPCDSDSLSYGPTEPRRKEVPGAWSLGRPFHVIALCTGAPLAAPLLPPPKYVSTRWNGSNASIGSHARCMDGNAQQQDERGLSRRAS